MLGKAHYICTPPHFSEVSSTLPLKQFQSSSDWWWPSCPFKIQGTPWSFASFHASLLQAINGVMSLALRASMQCFQLLNTSDLLRCKPLMMDALPASLSAQSFSFTPACPGQYLHSSFERRRLTIDIYTSLGFPFYSSLFVASSLNLWGRWHCGLTVASWGKPVEGMGDCFHLHCQAGGWDVQAALSSWMVVTNCLTMKPHCTDYISTWMHCTNYSFICKFSGVVLIAKFCVNTALLGVPYAFQPHRCHYTQNN